MASRSGESDNPLVYARRSSEGQNRSVRLLELCLALILVAPLRIEAQTRLSLEEAVARARTQATDVRAAQVGEREAQARLEQARAGLLPTVDFTESWQRG